MSVISSIEKLDLLKDKFSTHSNVHFSIITPNTIIAKLELNNSSVCISLFGATVISYITKNFGEILFLSKVGNFLPGKGIRGGIPLCWPWFGANLHNPNLPPHGFFRIFDWDVLDVAQNALETSIAFSLCDSEESRKFWPHSFYSICCITLGNQLKISMHIKNNDQEPWELSGAFHPYFLFSDIRNAEIPSFIGQEYVDYSVPNCSGNKISQMESLNFSGEVNRVYLYNGPVDIDDFGKGQRVSIFNDSLESTGVWTPWKTKCAATPDLGESVFTNFLCVEPGIIPPNVRTIEPSDTFKAGITIGVNSL
jgi:glucose-6-phosphate 1-epimerase